MRVEPRSLTRDESSLSAYESVIFDANPSDLIDYVMDGTKFDRGKRACDRARWWVCWQAAFVSRLKGET